MTKVKVSDYIADFLVGVGFSDVFLITGGGAMHLDDSLGKHPGLRSTYFHHEQACSLAADAYYRVSNRMPVVCVTSGPGGTNAITGVYGAYVDSMAMLVISGQVKFETTVNSADVPLRQLGDQEIDIVPVVRSITKLAEMVTDPTRVRFHLERALFTAREGRPGPVWLDIPLNVQGAMIDPETLEGFTPPPAPVKEDSTPVCDEILKRLAQAKRPVVLGGTGVWLSGQHANFLKLIEKLGVPVVTAWNSNDLVSNDNPWFAGRPGTIGDRPGNFAVQNSDFLLVLGSRLNVRMVSYNWKEFARDAFKVIVDIDPNELRKPTVKPDLPVNADLRDFIPALLARPYQVRPEHAEWMAWCMERRRRYPTVLPEYWNSPKVNNYCFVQTLFEELEEGDVVACANGAACVVTFQAAIVKNRQRIFHNSGCATMGFDLPAAIGACRALNPKRVICIAGDGSIQMNLQELQTIVGYDLPVKLFILNNDGYLSMKQTQENFFKGRYLGCNPASGVTFPNFGKVLPAYGIPYRECRGHDGMREILRATLNEPGASACELFLDLTQGFAPKLASKQLPDGRIVSPPPEDMAPFLTREELAENMFSPVVGD